MKRRLPVEIAPVEKAGMYSGFLVRFGAGQMNRHEVEGWFKRRHPLVRKSVNVALAIFGCSTPVSSAPVVRWGGTSFEMSGVTTMLREILGRAAKVQVIPAAEVVDSRQLF